MEHKKLNRIIAGIVFFISLLVLILTTQSGVPFWDCSEIASSAYYLQIPHPPGSPFNSLLGRIFMMIPVFDLGFRMNLMSAIAGSFTVLLTYLSSVILITLWRGVPKILNDKIIVYGSSAIGALALSFSDTFWFNAVESEVLSPSLFLLSLVVWLALKWYQTEETDEGNEKYFVLIGYLFGLSMGVHQLSLLAFFSVAFIFYFKKYEFRIRSFTYFALISIVLFIFVYKGIYAGLPALLSTSDGKTIFYVIGSLIIIGIFYGQWKDHGLLNFGLVLILFIILGYSTYTIIVIRAEKGLALNQNNPNNPEKLVSYLSREQYGDWPIINFDQDKYGGKVFPRRWTSEEYRVARFKNYKSDLDYLIRYQLYNMWFRYLLWNYAGRAGDVQDAPPAFLSDPNPKWLIGKEGTFPNKYYAIPLLLGLIGSLYHFYKDRKIAFSLWVLFLITGIGLMFYQNMQDPQPRERDYFFVGSFYVFAIWISLGVAGLLESIEAFRKNTDQKYFLISACSLMFITIPANMLFQNYDDHDRSGNFLAEDFAYNILQSCPKDAILITNGDNDTFPAWYLQDVLGIRRDIRIVNLSLLNADWYALQLKNETPYGSMKVPMSFSDQQIISASKEFYEWGKTRSINLLVSEKVYKLFIEEEEKFPKDFRTLVTLTNKNYSDISKYPAQITFNIKSHNSVTDQTGKIHYGLRLQDLLLLDIIRTNNWERPICFSVTNNPESKIGLDGFLRMEGLTYRLTPFNQNTRYEFVNPKIMFEHLTKEPQSFSQYPALGFRFRNLNNPNMYFDENATRIAQDYRRVFLNLSSYFVEYLKDTSKALEVIKAMSNNISSTSVRLDLRLKYNLFLFYNVVNKKDEIDKISTEIEKECINEINNNPRNVSSQFNPYRVLLDIYEISKQYSKELKLLEILQKTYPLDQSIKNKIDELNRIINPQQDVKVDSTNN